MHALILFAQHCHLTYSPKHILNACNKHVYKKTAAIITAVYNINPISSTSLSAHKLIWAVTFICDFLHAKYIIWHQQREKKTHMILFLRYQYYNSINTNGNKSLVYL